MNKLHGWEAIEAAEKNGARLARYKDDISNGRRVSITEAREIATKQDPGLIYTLPLTQDLKAQNGQPCLKTFAIGGSVSAFHRWLLKHRPFCEICTGPYPSTRIIDIQGHNRAVCDAHFESHHPLRAGLEKRHNLERRNLR